MGLEANGRSKRRPGVSRADAHSTSLARSLLTEKGNELKKKLASILVLGLLATAVVLPAAPAQASVTGGLVIQCTANLPEFPSPANTGSCNGSGLGAAITVPAHVLAPSAASVGGFTSDFNYNEECVAGEPPVIGFANGFGHVPVTVLPELADDTLNLHFNWIRVGLTAVITVDSLTLNNFADVTGSLGAAVAGFAPLIGPGNVCGPTGTGDPLQAVVVAAGAAAI